MGSGYLLGSANRLIDRTYTKKGPAVKMQMKAEGFSSVGNAACAPILVISQSKWSEITSGMNAHAAPFGPAMQHLGTARGPDVEASYHPSR